MILELVGAYFQHAALTLRSAAFQNFSRRPLLRFQCEEIKSQFELMNGGDVLKCFVFQRPGALVVRRIIFACPHGRHSLLVWNSRLWPKGQS
jgi:hypothetical protein